MAVGVGDWDGGTVDVLVGVSSGAAVATGVAVSAPGRSISCTQPFSARNTTANEAMVKPRTRFRNNAPRKSRLLSTLSIAPLRQRYLGLLQWQAEEERRVVVRVWRDDALDGDLASVTPGQGPGYVEPQA